MKPVATFLFVLAFPLAALAQAPEPPGRVGRVAWTQGEVVVHADPERGWEKALVNTPLTSENSLWTEPAARAEMRIGSTALRLEEGTQLDVRRLDDEQLSAHVVRGALTVSIRHFETGERYIVSTPQARFLLLANGRYRVDADEARGYSRLTVFSGSAHLDTAGRRVSVGANEAVAVFSDGAGFEFERASITPFDEWSLARDERVIDRDASRYVSPRMTGYEDLDQYGSWSQDPDYGAVWYPNSVGNDYVPYQDGNWTYTQPFGWTWVDYAPWGYAPFHYGRWVRTGHRWGWCPGNYVRRPVWAPALVGWVGRPGWSVTVGAGSRPVVGWYPLSPHDRYRPWYTNNPRYHDRVNDHVRPRPGSRPRDRDDDNRARGTTIVLREGFVGQRPVRNSLVPVSGEVAAAQPIAQAAAVLPSRSEIPTRKPLAVGASPIAPRPVSGQPAGPGRGESAARTEGSGRGQPMRPPTASIPSRPLTVAPNYRSPVAGAPAEPRAVEPRVAEPRPQTKPLRVAPAPQQPPAASMPSAPVHAPAARARPPQPPQTIQLQEQPAAAAPAPAPQATRESKPVARERDNSNDKPDKPERAERDNTPPPAPTTKPMRVQQR